MALTRIRGEQIHSRQIKRHHVIDTTDGGDGNDTLIYTQMDLSSSIVSSDLDTTGVSGNAPSGTGSVHGAVLDSRLIALWDTVLSMSVSGSSTVATAEVTGASATDTSTQDFTTKGVLLTGTGTNGAGIENYKVNIRDANTKHPIPDANQGAVYAELTESAGEYTLSFYDTSGSPFSLNVQQQTSIFAKPAVLYTTVDGVDVTLAGRYFNFDTPDTSYYVWFTVDGAGSDPAISGRTGIQVDVLSSEGEVAVAGKVATAMDAMTDLGAANPSGNEIVVTAASTGPAEYPSDGEGNGESGFTFDVTTEGITGSVDFMFREVYSYLDAPADAFVTGMGFADIVGVSGSHNHNDLYYTKVELESGQLDDRYATRSDLNGGELDSRYYTESELDPYPGTDDGSGVLDTRYFTEGEITSTTDGSSGADLIGLTPYTAAGGEQLLANTVQGAVEELQDDIDAIVSGGLDITHSLDDAYNDGSVVVVDGNDGDGAPVAGKDRIDFQLADTHKFIVSDGTNELLDVTHNATSGNAIEITNAEFKVTDQPSTFTGNISQSSGSATFNTGAEAFDVDSGTFTIDGTAASVVNVAGANLGIRTTTSGNLNLTSAGELNLKDVHLGSALPLADASNAALSSNFDSAISIVGALNENVDDLTQLIDVDLPAVTDGAAGADMVGATGITGVIPGGSSSGNAVGDSGTVQEMLEGIAQSAGGVKTYADEAAFISAKQAGEYLPVDTMFYLKDTDRFGIVIQESVNAVEGTDWDYLWGANQPLAGDDFKVTAGAFNVDTAGAVAINTDTGLTLDDDSGAHLGLAASGQVDIDSAAGQMVQMTSDTEVEIDGGALVDIDGDAVTIDGQLTATGAADDNMIVTTSGLGEVQLSSAQEVDLTGGDIDINAGTGKTVYIDSDTEVQVNGGATLDLDATTITADATDIQTTGVLTQTGNAQVIGDLDMDGSVDMDGASATFDTTANFAVTAATDVDIAGNTVDLDANGGHVGLTSSGQVDVDSATGQIVDVTSDTEVQIDGGALVDIDGDDVTIDGQFTATGGDGDNMVVSASGTGQVQLSSSGENGEIDLNASLIDVHGDISMASERKLYTDHINITSVDPSDYATIEGYRGGTLNPANLLSNPGFESGSGADADSWTEGFAGRTSNSKFYGDWALGVTGTSTTMDQNIATQGLTGLTIGSHVLSFWAKGNNTGMPIKATLNGGTEVEVVPAGALTSSYQRFSVDITPSTADGNLSLDFTDNGGVTTFYIDAVMLEEGTGAASDYFTDYISSLRFTIGDEANDNIIFRSEASGSFNDLMRINQSTVEVMGDLLVSGTTTTVNSTEVDIADEKISLLSGQTAGNNDAYYAVYRGSDPEVSVKWNESTDKWELTNDGSTFQTIMTSDSGADTLSLDVAYDGGSTIAVDDTNVVWQLSNGNFQVVDGTDTSKLVVTQGSGLDSVKVDTSGGVDIDALAGVTIDGDTVITGATQVVGAMDFDGDIDHDGAAFNSTVSGDFGVSADTFTTTTFGAATIDAGSISLDAVGPSNFTTADADLTLSTTGAITPGDVIIDSVASVDISSGISVDVESPAINTAGVLTQTGNAQVVGDLDLDGNYVQDGNYTFQINTTSTAADSVDIDSAGGVDVDVETFAVDATSINTTGVLTQTGDTQIIGVMDLDGSIDSDGEDINIAASGTGGTHLQLSSADGASITSEGFSLDAGLGAFDLQGDSASTVNVDGAALNLTTTTSGNVALGSVADVTFNDQYQTAARAFSQASADGFAPEFGYDQQTDFNWSVRSTGTDAITSVMGAVNANRQDLYEYVELVATQGAAIGVSAGANLIGADGITGVTPTGKAQGDDGTVQEMLEGLAVSGGGGKTYADETAFTNAKASGDYFKTYEHVWILDSNRQIRVLAQGTGTVEGTDWDYVGDTNQVVGGGSYQFNLLDATADSFAVTTAGGVDVSASGAIALDGVGASNFTTDSGDLTVSTTTSGNVSISAADNIVASGNTIDVDGTLVDIDSTGSVQINSADSSNFTTNGANLTLSTTSSGNVVLNAADTVDIDGTSVDIDTASYALDSTGSVSIDASAGSNLTVTGGDLLLETISSGEIKFKDTRQTTALPLTDSANPSLDHDSTSSAPTSLYDAINRAYNNTGDTARKDYIEKPVDSTVVGNDYIDVSSMALNLPGFDGGGDAEFTPSGLRGGSQTRYFIAVYLNGLRLNDSEWVYWYDDTDKRHMISFIGTASNYGGSATFTVTPSSDVTLVSGDTVTIDLTVNEASNV